jgi:hypothetical protein
MTPKNRKILLICLGIVAASFIVRSAVEAVMRIEYNRRQAAIRAQKAKKPSPMPPPDDMLYTFRTNPVQPKPVSPTQIMGAWEGKAVLEPRGICDLRLEIKASEDGAFSGFSTFSCISVRRPQSLYYANPLSLQGKIAEVMRQDSAILTGKAEGNSIHFALAQAIGANINGCAVTSLTTTSFGTNRLAVEWKDGKCPDASALLQRARS